MTLKGEVELDKFLYFVYNICGSGGLFPPQHTTEEARQVAEIKPPPRLLPPRMEAWMASKGQVPGQRPLEKDLPRSFFIFAKALGCALALLLQGQADCAPYTSLLLFRVPLIFSHCL